MSALKKLYGEIAKVEDQDDGTIKVWGVASSQAEDSDGETITAEAMKAALPDYMKFGAVREMHQPKAAGTAIEAEVQEDGTTKFCAHVVDSEAVKKVKTGVYKGFSIGGKVLPGDKGRNPLNKSEIVGLKLIEVSLVDRPANPEAVITMYKAELAEPKQVWHCGNKEHVHISKAECVSCIEKGENTTDEQSADDSAINKSDDTDQAIAPAVDAGVSAGDGSAAEKSDEPQDLKKGMWAVADFAGMLNSISYMVQSAASEAEWEGDNSPLPAQLSAWLKTGTEIFRAMAAEEIAEMLAALPQGPVETEVVEMSDKGGDLQKAGARNSKSDLEKIQTMHDHSVALGAQCGSADKSAQPTDLAKMAGDDIAKFDKDALQPFADAWFVKFATDQGIESPVSLLKYMEAVDGELAKRATRITELEVMAAPAKGALRAIGKGEDIGSVEGGPAIAPVIKADGSTDDVASEIKKIHATGGQPYRPGL